MSKKKKKKKKSKKKHKSKDEVKEELIKSLVNGEEYEREELNGSVDNAKSYQDAIPIIQGYDMMFQRKRNTTVIAHRQGCVFKYLKTVIIFYRRWKK